MRRPPRRSKAKPCWRARRNPLSRPPSLTASRADGPDNMRTVALSLLGNYSLQALLEACARVRAVGHQMAQQVRARLFPLQYSSSCGREPACMQRDKQSRLGGAAGSGCAIHWHRHGLRAPARWLLLLGAGTAGAAALAAPPLLCLGP